MSDARLRIAEQLRDFGRGYNREAVAGLLGAPVDIAGQAANLGIAGIGYAGHKLGLLPQPPSLIDKPVGGSDWIYERLPRQPQMSGSGAETVGRVTGALLSPGVAIKAAPAAGKAVARALQEKLPGMAEHYLRGIGGQKDIIAYHGTPWDFERFDSSKIGTGEGAQAFGHGLYLAEAPAVAQQYANNVKDLKTVQRLNAELIHLAGLARNDPAAAQRYAQLAAERQRVVNTPGYVYRVDVPDPMVERMLDWDKPLSQQAPEVRAALTPEAMGLQYQQLPNGNHAFINVQGSPVGNLQKGGTPAGFRANWLDSITNDNLPGRQVYQQINGGMFGADKASAALRQAGIPGIRYLDEASRAAGSGTSNLVIFPGEEQHLRILDRTGGPQR